MVLKKGPPKLPSRRASSSRTEEPAKPSIEPYKGEFITRADHPLYLSCSEKFYIDKSHPIDKAIGEYLSSQKNMLRLQDGREYKSYPIENMSLDEMLNAEISEKTTSDDENIFRRLDMKKYSPKGVGQLVIGRYGTYIPPKDDFIIKNPNDPKEVEFYKSRINDFIEYTLSDPEQLEGFVSVLKGESGKNKRIDPDDLFKILRSLNPKDPRAMATLGLLYSKYFFPTIAKLIPLKGTPNFYENMPAKLFVVDFFADPFISGYRCDEDDIKAHAFAIQKGKRTDLADPLSTSGNVVTLTGKTRNGRPLNMENMIKIIKKQKETDKDDELFTRNAGKADVESFVRPAVNGVIVDMTRDPDHSEKTSPITYLPNIIDAASEEEQTAHIAMGMKNPVTGERTKTLIISNIPLKR